MPTQLRFFRSKHKISFMNIWTSPDNRQRSAMCLFMILECEFPVRQEISFGLVVRLLPQQELYRTLAKEIICLKPSSHLLQIKRQYNMYFLMKALLIHLQVQTSHHIAFFNSVSASVFHFSMSATYVLLQVLYDYKIFSAKFTSYSIVE